MILQHKLILDNSEISKVYLKHLEYWKRKCCLSSYIKPFTQTIRALHEGDGQSKRKYFLSQSTERRHNEN